MWIRTSSTCPNGRTVAPRLTAVALSLAIWWHNVPQVRLRYAHVESNNDARPRPPAGFVSISRDDHGERYLASRA